MWGPIGARISPLKEYYWTDFYEPLKFTNSTQIFCLTKVPSLESSRRALGRHDDEILAGSAYKHIGERGGLGGGAEPPPRMINYIMCDGVSLFFDGCSLNFTDDKLYCVLQILLFILFV